VEIEKELKQYVINKFLQGEVGRVGNDQSLFESGAIDSLGVLHLVSFIEERFKVKVGDEELIPDNFETMNKLINFVQGKYAARVSV
jgi:acyl carrier protein